MAFVESSLSVAIAHFADFLSNELGNEVQVTVDTPQKASERAKESQKPVLNLFVYRLAPSGLHPEMGSDEHFFLRAFVLLTAFPTSETSAPPDEDLRVMGEAIRVLQSKPIIEGEIDIDGASFPSGNLRLGAEKYRLNVVFQSPAMEELNHIWTTQGGELAYRMSAAYELALIPIQPLNQRSEPTAVKKPEFVLSPGAGPLLLFAMNGQHSTKRGLVAGSNSVDISLSGEINQKVLIKYDWRRSSGELEQQSGELLTISAADLQAADAQVSLNIDASTEGDRACLTAYPVTADGMPASGKSASNTIELTIEP